MKKNTSKRAKVKKFNPRDEDPMLNRRIWDVLNDDTKAKLVDTWPSLKSL